MTITIADRIVGCLKGIATGDAIGKQTETLSREDVLRWTLAVARLAGALASQKHPA